MLLLLLACAAPDNGGSSDGGETGTGDTGGSALVGTLPADFALPDLNPGSDRHGDTVSPRDYLTRVSGYYFIHST